MSRTLLYTVQRVMDKLNLDSVNFINETEDAYLVAREAETTFYDLLSRGDWPQNESLLSVESVSDLASPTTLRLKDSTSEIKSLRYKLEDESYRHIHWMEPEEFLEKTNYLNADNDDVFISKVNDRDIKVYNNNAPRYYTSFDNEHLVFDSWDSEVEDTLVGDKVICLGYKLPDWELTDSFVIPVQDNIYPLYLSALTSACSVFLLGTQNVEEERRQQRAISRLRRESIRTEKEYFHKNKYGRNGNGLS